MTISEEVLAAYADGELNDLERLKVERAVLADPDLRRQLDQQIGLRARFSGHFAPVADEPVSARFRILLTGVTEDDKVVSINAARERRRLAMPVWRNLAAIAATLVVGIFVGHYSASVGDTTIGAPLAQGSLATALNSQLASSQAPSAPIRIGVSFRNQDDALCRTYASVSQQGIACKQGGNWIINTATWNTQIRPATDYRQASATDPLIMQAAQAMMKGDALNAEAERAALGR